MLKVARSSQSGADYPDSPELSLPVLDVPTVLAMLRRQWPTAAAITGLCVLLAIGYLLGATPKYTATSRIMIDTRKNQLLQNQQVLGDQTIDSGVIDSQVEILKSESIALAVIRDQKLTEDPEFAGGPGIVEQLSALISGSTPEPSEEERTAGALKRFMNATTAKRIGLTYVIQIDFTSISAEKSARIAGGIVDAYMVGELEAKYQATKRASKWLQERIAELREQASNQEKAVQSFKAKNNIVDTGRGLMSEQQLSDVGTQLVTARAATAEAKARQDRITEILNSNDIPDATVSDALRNDVITRLRAQYLDLSARESDWAARFGVNHSATVNLRNQMREIRRSILSEISRIADAYKSDYQIALAREQSLQRSLDNMISENGASGEARVKLRDLESSAQTSRNLYDNFLQKFMEATQQQSFPIAESRVIAAASTPTSPSSPKALLAIAAGLMGGLFLGIGGAIGRELLNKTFRTAADVEKNTGYECLGILPRFLGKSSETKVPGAALRNAAADHQIEAIHSPFSRFAETLRNVKVSADIARLEREVKVIGVVSSLPKEGKTTVASNLAHLIAVMGNSTLLIDADLRNPSLTRTLAPDASQGLLEVLDRQVSITDAIRKDPQTGLNFLPAVVPSRISNTPEILASNAMRELITAVRGQYEYVVIDYAPVCPVVDVKASSHLVDGYVFVVEWGRTSQEAVSDALSSVGRFRNNVLGIVLNKADASVLRRHEAYKGRHYYDYYLDGAPGKK
jgi:succinoglycan biosynthesis transport protein ExoP